MRFGFPAALTCRVAPVVGRCRLPIGSRFDVGHRRRSLGRVESVGSSLRFFAVESDGCSPACGDRENSLHASTHPLDWRRPPRRAGGRSVKASAILSAESAKRAFGRPATPDCINRLVVRCRSCAAAFSFPRGVPLPAITDSAAWPDRSDPAALMGFTDAFRRFDPSGGRQIRFREAPGPHAVCRIAPHHRPFSSMDRGSDVFVVLCPTRSRIGRFDFRASIPFADPFARTSRKPILP